MPPYLRLATVVYRARAVAARLSFVVIVAQLFALPTSTSASGAGASVSTPLPVAAVSQTNPGHANVQMSPPQRSARSAGSAPGGAIDSPLTGGDTFTLDVVAELQGSALGWQFGLTFNPTVVQVTTITPSDWLSSFAAAAGPQTGVWTQPWAVDNVNGTVVPGAQTLVGLPATGGPASGVHVLATVGFVAVGSGDASVQMQKVVVTNSAPAALTLPPTPLLRVAAGANPTSARSSLVRPASHYQTPPTPLFNGRPVPMPPSLSANLRDGAPVRSILSAPQLDTPPSTFNLLVDVACDTGDPNGIDSTLKNQLRAFPGWLGLTDTNLHLNQDYPDGLDSNTAIHQLLAGQVDLAISTRLATSNDDGFANQRVLAADVLQAPIGLDPLLEPVWAILPKYGKNPDRMVNYALTTDAVDQLMSSWGQANLANGGWTRLAPSGRILDADVNLDFIMDISDLALVGLGGTWGSSDLSHPHWIRADTNRDGFIDVSDLSTIGLAGNWNHTWALPQQADYARLGIGRMRVQLQASYLSNSITWLTFGAPLSDPDPPGVSSSEVIAALDSVYATGIQTGNIPGAIGGAAAIAHQQAVDSVRALSGHGGVNPRIGLVSVQFPPGGYNGSIWRFEVDAFAGINLRT